MAPNAVSQEESPCNIGSWDPPFDHGGNAPQTPVGCAFVPSPPPPFYELPNGTKFNAIHASLIPVGLDQGKILVWKAHAYSGDPAGETRVLYWSIVDPINQTFQNYEWCLPHGAGDLFCAGHAWTADGKLLVAGGSGWHGNAPTMTPCSMPGQWTGSKLTFLFDPTVPYDPMNPTVSNPWTQVVPGLETDRWYPSVVILGEHATNLSELIVAGGTNCGQGIPSYQAFIPTNSTWESSGQPGQLPHTFVGPSGTSNFAFTAYPRLFLLSNGLAVTAGFSPGSSRLDHYQLQYTFSNTRWEPNDPLWIQQDPVTLRVFKRTYGTAVQLPITLPNDGSSIILSIGGRDNNNNILSSVQRSNAVSSGNAKYWTTQSFPDLAIPRWLANSVLLPDRTVLVVGGDQADSQGCATDPAYTPELYRAGAWHGMKPGTIIRDYHSTALLLPDARVLTAGGESRRYQAPPPGQPCAHNPTTEIAGPSDYQIFDPPYVSCGNPRPVITSTASAGNALAWPLGSQQQVTYQPLADAMSISSVVLARAGSVTHHCDPNQRLVALDFIYVPDTDPPTPGYQPTVQVTVPSSSYVLPKGYYMLFLVDNAGTPSVATWVQIQ